MQSLKMENRYPPSHQTMISADMSQFPPSHQTMLSQEVFNLKSSTVHPPLSFNEKKRVEAQLILGSTYALNHSETKRISVGLQPLETGQITPVLKLQNNNSSGGIVFNSSGFSILHDCLSEITQYFEGTQKTIRGSSWRTPSAIRIDDCEIIFTTSFGAKSIVFDRISEEVTEIRDVTSEPPQKKARQYSPAVVMQKTTFEGLCNVITCVDEHFKRLQRCVSDVEMCVRLVCAELLLHVPSNEKHENINEVCVKELIKNNHKSLKEAVKVRMDSSFAENYFEIVFLEVTVLCVPFITNEIKKSVIELEELTR